MEEKKNKILLNVPTILQNPELPNGCEITSCCELLRFWGYKADKCDLADHYLPRSPRWYGADPDKVYMGDPHREDDSEMCGFYCFAGPVVEAADRYIKDHRNDTVSDMTAIDITGTEQAGLEQYLKEGLPFLFWASLRFDDIGFDPRGSYLMEDGRTHRLFRGLHCMVCKGMDEEYFYIANPLGLNSKIPKEQFWRVLPYE